MGLSKMKILKTAKTAATTKLAQVSKAVKTKKDDSAKSKADELSQIYAEQKAEMQAEDADDTILALDIGTENVKAVIARQNTSGGLDIIGIGRARKASTNMYAGAIADIPAVVEVCEKALSQAEKMSGTTSKLTVVGIAGELIKGNTSTVRYRRKSGNKPLSEQEMALIIKRVQDRAG